MESKQSSETDSGLGTIKEDILEPTTIKQEILEPTNVKEELLESSNDTDILSIKEDILEPTIVKQEILEPTKVKEELLEPSNDTDILSIIKEPKEEIKDDPFAYIDKNGFTSEKFKIEIRGLPRFWGIGQLKKLLKTKLQLNFNKIKIRKKEDNWVYVCFRTEEDKEKALKVINGVKWKNKTLSATSAKPAPDPLVKRRIEASGEKSELQNLTLEERVKHSTVPLWKLSAEEQATRKTEMVTKSIRNIVFDIEKINTSLKPFFSQQRKINNGLPLEMSPMVTSDCLTGYRNKCEFTIGINEETGEKTVGQRVGTYASGTVGVGPIYDLPHIPDKMKDAVKVVERFVQASPLDVFNPETYSGNWRGLTLRYSKKTEQLMLIVVIHPQQLSQQQILAFKEELKDFFTAGEGRELNLTSLYYQEVSKKRSGEDQPVELLLGESHITEILCGLKFKISPVSFFQVNTATAELLYDTVRSLTRLTPQTTLVDVCCGTGSIGISLAKDCGQVLGLELIEQAVADARENAALNDVTNCDFYSGPAEEILQSVINKAKFEDVVAVVDPPRPGLRQNAVAMLRRISKIKRIAYLACHINSAAQNIKDLAKPQSKTMAGAPFVPVAVTPVDMFPYTEHCEVIIYLERREDS